MRILPQPGMLVIRRAADAGGYWVIERVGEDIPLGTGIHADFKKGDEILCMTPEPGIPVPFDHNLRLIGWREIAAKIEDDHEKTR